MKILSTTGVWLQSEAQFPMIDPTNNTRFEPGEVVKAEHTDWVKGQPSIKTVDDPSGAPVKALAGDKAPTPAAPAK